MQCCLAGSSKTAPRILIFFQLPLVPIIHLSWIPSRPMPPIFGHNNLFLGSVSFDENCFLSKYVLTFHRIFHYHLLPLSRNWYNRYIRPQKSRAKFLYTTFCFLSIRFFQPFVRNWSGKNIFETIHNFICGQDACSNRESYCCKPEILSHLICSTLCFVPKFTVCQPII